LLICLNYLLLAIHLWFNLFIET